MERLVVELGLCLTATSQLEGTNKNGSRLGHDSSLSRSGPSPCPPTAPGDSDYDNAAALYFFA